MKYFDNNELNPKKILKFLESRIVVDEKGYNSEKKRFFYRYVSYDENSQNLFLTTSNGQKNKKTRKYDVNNFIKKTFLYEYSENKKNNGSSYKFKKKFLCDMEDLLVSSPAITLKAKEKIEYILNNFFFANISNSKLKTKKSKNPTQ